MADQLGNEPTRATSRPVAGVVTSEISRAMVQLTARFTGRGPTKTRTTVDANLVVVIFDDTLTKAEHNLVNAGEVESVAAQRRTLNGLLRADAIALVEKLTSRAVVSMLSDIDPDQNVAALVFVLEPEPAPGIADTTDASP